MIGVGALLALGGCASPPADAWTLAPIRPDNTPPGGPASAIVDVTFPMRLASDTRGGVWGTSAGSWLHLGAEGQTLQRFNLDPNTAPRVEGLAAVSPTQLVVTASAGELTDSMRAVMLFDTERMTWDTLQAERFLLGDVAVHDDEVFYVRITGEGRFEIARVALGERADAEVVSPELRAPSAAVDASGIALAVAPDGTLYVATADEHLVMSPEGELIEREAVVSARPLVAVSPAGRVAWVSAPRPGARPNVALVDASREARELITGFLECESEGLTLGPLALPLCTVGGIAWLDDDTLAVSAGGEGGAPLIRVTPPR